MTPDLDRSDERVVLDADSRADTVAFRAFVIGETRRARIDGPSVAVSPIPEHLTLRGAEEGHPEESIHDVEFQSLPSGRYCCGVVHDNGEYERAIFAPFEDGLRERLAVAFDDQATLGEVIE